MKELEANMRKIEMDGLTWGASKLVPVGYGIKKLQVNLVVEDEKVSIDELQQKIEEDGEHVQSTDVVSSLDAPSPNASRTDQLRLPCKSCDNPGHSTASGYLRVFRYRGVFSLFLKLARHARGRSAYTPLLERSAWQPCV
jgi:translation elongation factor EF-1beta